MFFRWNVYSIVFPRQIQYEVQDYNFNAESTYFLNENCIETVEWTCPPDTDCKFDEISIELTRSDNNQWSIDEWSIPAYKYLFTESGGARYQSGVNRYDNSVTDDFQYKYVFREVICSDSPFNLTKKDSGSDGWNG